MPKPKTSQAELHRLIGIGLKETGLVRARDVSKSSHRIEGRSLSGLYQALARGSGITRFGGHSNWYTYLRAVHGIKEPEERIHLRGPIAAHKLTDDQIHGLILGAIHATGKSTANDWRSSKTTHEGHTLGSLFKEASNRKVGKTGFWGHGYWDIYLEKKHGLIPIGQNRWSGERLHWTVAALIRKHPPEKVSWRENQKPVILGKTLENIWQLIYARKFFGQPNFKAYIKWVRKNYPDSEKVRDKWIAEAHEQESKGDK